MVKVLDCYHCGNRTQMLLLSDYKDAWEEKGLAIWGYNQYLLYKCPVCLEVTLENVSFLNEDIICLGYTDYEQKNAYENAKIKRILYPQHSFEVENIPEKVRGSFEAALKIRRIEPNTCAVAIRRTLEMMCKDKNAEGKTLERKLSYLAINGVLPEILQEAAYIIRKLGNTAAHANDEEVSYELANQMVKFTEAILDYVYVIPSKIEKIQQDI